MSACESVVPALARCGGTLYYFRAFYYSYNKFIIAVN